MNYFPRGLVLSMMRFVAQHIAWALVSVSKSSSTVVDIFCSVENKLNNFVFCQSVLDVCLLKVNRVILFRDVLRLTCINAAPNDDSLAVLTADRAQPAK